MTLFRPSDIMTDEEVGKAWRCSPLLDPPGEEVVKQIIRKLVHETLGSPFENSELIEVLTRFGIDKKEWT